MGNNGKDLLRDESGKALVGDERNDENGLIAAVHLAFQRYHNLLIDRMLHGIPPESLSQQQKTALFQGVRNLIVARYQGMVANEMAVAFTGVPVPDNVEPIENVPVEFAGAVFRLGHTLVPHRIRVNARGDTFSPIDPQLRGDASFIDLNQLFGDSAQPAAEFDSRIAQVMRELIIQHSPRDPGQGHQVGGRTANLGQGKTINGVLHLDLIETNILRSREQRLPSGEECFARIYNREYNPSIHGNTDLWPYILRESDSFHHLGVVGSYVFQRTIGGLLSGDPNRYSNKDIYTSKQIAEFRAYRVEDMLRELGDIQESSRK